MGTPKSEGGGARDMNCEPSASGASNPGGMNRRDPAGAPRGGVYLRVFSTPLIVVKGRELLISQTFTHPSWLATAYLRPSEDHVVLKAASLKASECVTIGENITLSPPEIACRYTDGVSPTASNVRPSGDIEAAR